MIWLLLFTYCVGDEPCFIITVIITTLRSQLWCRQNIRYGWCVFGSSSRHVICTHYSGEAPSPVSLSSSSKSTAAVWLIRKREPSQPPASSRAVIFITVPSAYCFLLASHSFPLSSSSPLPALHPFFLILLPPATVCLCICFSISCFNSLTSRAIISLLLFLLRRKKKWKEAWGGRQEAIYIKMNVIIPVKGRRLHTQWSCSCPIFQFVCVYESVMWLKLLCKVWPVDSEM